MLTKRTFHQRKRTSKSQLLLTRPRPSRPDNFYALLLCWMTCSRPSLSLPFFVLLFVVRTTFRYGKFSFHLEVHGYFYLFLQSKSKSKTMFTLFNLHLHILSGFLTCNPCVLFLFPRYGNFSSFLKQTCCVVSLSRSFICCCFL